MKNIIFQGLCTLANNRGELNLRHLYLDKEQLKKKMTALWEKRESGKEWTKKNPQNMMNVLLGLKI